MKRDANGYKFHKSGKKTWKTPEGLLHRVDGPAIEYLDGTKAWWIEGNLHRTDGPAIEYSDGTKEWFLEGKLHRTDGPAIEYLDGTKAWWVEGIELTEKEWLAKMKPIWDSYKSIWDRLKED